MMSLKRCSRRSCSSSPAAVRGRAALSQQGHQDDSAVSGGQRDRRRRAPHRAELQKSLGQPVVIENQPGADGIIAAQNAKRAAPDGYTLFVSTNSAHGANPAIYTNLPYDPEKDFEPVAGLIRIPQLMVVRKDFPADDVAGFVKIAKERAPSRR